MKLYIKINNITKEKEFCDFWDSLKFKNADIFDLYENNDGESFFLVDIKEDKSDESNLFINKIRKNFNATLLNDDLTLKFPDEILTL